MNLDIFKIIKNAYSLLTASEKKQSALLLLISGVAGILEILSIWLITQLIVGTGQEVDSGFLSNILDSVRLFFDVSLVSVTFLILTLTLIVSILNNWMVNIFATRFGIALGNRVFEISIGQPLSYLHSVDPSEIAKKIFQESQRVMGQIFVPIMNVASKFIIAIMIFLFILRENYIIALSMVGLFGTLYLIMFALIKLRLYKNSNIISDIGGRRFRSLADAISSITEIRFYGLIEQTRIKFNSDGGLLAKAIGENQAMVQIPKNIVEYVFFSLIILFYIYSNSDISSIGLNSSASIAPILLAGIKLLPTIQQIFNGIATVSGNQTAISDIEAYLIKSERSMNDHAKISHRMSILDEGTAILVEDNRRNKQFSILKNKLNVVVGKSGSGKTSLIEAILGLRKFDGKVLFSKNIFQNKKINEKIAYVPQKPFIVNDSIKKNITTFDTDCFDANRFERALMVSGFDKILKKRGVDVNFTIYGYGLNFSGGESHRLAIARAVYLDRDILIMDEYSAALDSQTEGEVLNLLQSHMTNKTIILVTHSEKIIKAADNMVNLDD